jgi:hypothetical protein
MSHVRVSTTLDAPATWVAQQLQSTAVFRHITAPLLRFTPVDSAWPTHWTPGDTLVLRMALFGLLPLGRQTVRIRVEASAEPGGWPVLRDAGDGQLLRRWDHRITLTPLPGGRTLYTDSIDLEARRLPRLLTPFSAAFARWFYTHRQRRWRALALCHASVPPSAPPRP